MTKCPQCNSLWIWKRGFRKIKHGKKQVYQCRSCKRIFVLYPKRTEITDNIKQDVIKLYHTYKPTTNKFDAMKKATCSTREIARRLGISYSAVGNIIKKNSL